MFILSAIPVPCHSSKYVRTAIDILSQRYTNTEYCEKEYGETDRTAKAIGAAQTYKQKIHENPVNSAYNKEYKKRFAWIKYGEISKDAFYEWSKQAQVMRDKALASEVTLVMDFLKWTGFVCYSCSKTVKVRIPL